MKYKEKRIQEFKDEFAMDIVLDQISYEELEQFLSETIDQAIKQIPCCGHACCCNKQPITRKAGNRSLDEVLDIVGSLEEKLND